MNDQQTLRLGFAVKVLGQPDLPSHDTRRWQNNPHLRVSLGYLAQIFDYLQREQISMYRRLRSDLPRYALDVAARFGLLREKAG